MTTQPELIDRLQARPRDFTWKELVTLLAAFGFDAPRGSGPSRQLVHPGTAAVLMMHEPYLDSILKLYQVRAVLGFLKNEGYIA